MSVALDTLAQWLRDGIDPPGGWRPGWKRMAERHLRGKPPAPVVRQPRKPRQDIVVAPEVQAERIAACNACPNLRATRSCALCGCGAEVDHLAKRPWHQCPDGRWNRTLSLDQL